MIIFLRMTFFEEVNLKKIWRRPKNHDSFLVGDDKKRIIFANSLDPDQDQQHMGPDLDPKVLAL